MTHYVYSTATNSGTYVEYEKNPSSDLARAKKWPDGTPMKVTIKGGHGLADKHLFTPKGVVTAISDRELELLERNPSFQRHIKAGFMVVDKKKVNPAKRAKDMKDRDGSAPLTPADYVKSEYSSGNQTIYKSKRQIAVGE